MALLDDYLMRHTTMPATQTHSLGFFSFPEHPQRQIPLYVISDYHASTILQWCTPL